MNETPRFRLRPKLKREIARLNESQNAVARACGLSSGYMSQLLSGKRHPGPSTRARLLEHLHLEFDQVFEEVE